jgi:hypothetical protein
MTEILIHKFQRQFLAQFLPASLLGVSAAVRAEKSEIIITQTVTK